MIVTIDNLQPGKTYSIQLKANTLDGPSDWSKAFSVTTVSDSIAPKTPTGLAVVASNTTYTITWSPVTQSSDNSAATDLSYYDVKVDNNAGVTVNYTTAGTKYDFSLEKNIASFGTAAGTINVAVRAVDKFGNASAYSSAVQTVTSAPNPPTSVSATSLVDSINVTWVRSTSPNIFEYQVFTGTTAGFTPTGTPLWRGNGTSAVIKNTDFVNATYVKVIAVDTFGKQSTAAVSNSTTPVNSQASANGKNTIYYSTTAPTNQPNIAGDTWFVRELVGGTVVGQYEGMGGTSWAARTVSSQVIANLDAGKITSGTLAVGTTITAGTAGGVRTDINASGITSYVQLGPPATLTTNTDATGLLTTSGDYYYAVTSTDASGESVAVYATKAVVDGLSYRRVFVNWTQVEGATGYNVYRSIASPSGGTAGAWQLKAQVPSTTIKYIDNSPSVISATNPPTTSTTGFVKSLYAQNGQLNVIGSLQGTLKTNPSGARFEIGRVPGAYDNTYAAISAYTGNGSEQYPGKISVSSDYYNSLVMSMSAPSYNADGSGGAAISVSNSGFMTLKAGTVDASTAQDFFPPKYIWRNKNDYAGISSPPMGWLFDYTLAMTNATGFSVGTGGFMNGRWTRIGNLVHVFGDVQFGSNPTFGTGDWYFSLPFGMAPIAPLARTALGTVWVNPRSNVSVIGAPVIAPGASNFRIFAPNSATTNNLSVMNGASTPGGQAWQATNGYIKWYFAYETNVDI